MRSWSRVIVAVALWVMVGMGLLGCGKGGPPGPAAAPTVLVQQTVTVAGGGGGAPVTFAGTSGWRIRITLAAANNTTVPYAFLECRPGTGVYQPPQETASNGNNSVTLTLTQTGNYTLTVFDGTNHGGAVAVKVERLS